MKAITFTEGQINTLSEEYFTLKLYNLGKLVYSATIPLDIVNKYLAKYKNIKVVN